MKLPLTSFLLLWLLSVSGVAHSADYEKGKAAWQAGDFATAVSEWKPLAEQGDARAQARLGWMYDNGWGVPMDDQTALKWYIRAAEQGYAQGQVFLALMYARGKAVPKDFVHTYMWFSLAAANGHTDAKELKDSWAQQLTPADLATAERLAQECLAKNYKGC